MKRKESISNRKDSLYVIRIIFQLINDYVYRFISRNCSTAAYSFTENLG
ncbi:hypothetical protein ME1_00090 [Bartonella vinsonii subsp. arupensis OK-94-513]|uniref:Uncharacterized protein n=2 Tax=Bartonella vinsonii subsp. arupensis TaxID=110578 RepID=J1K1F0_BARVI|nr:hypothetical protein [Bartonella vinsonii]EJF90890.1 hypothetical protein ME1_00090 [Bartonella vinsonii subsp. arupensis OK-94-513]EJF97645.1 hypothetical protein MEI_01339 [Bartonella vinsonii subsp. arupensis Pm136co]